MCEQLVRDYDAFANLNVNVRHRPAHTGAGAKKFS
jgi:hypothetical protein